MNTINYYLNNITNLYIYLTFIFCIILIIDELFNIGIFSFKYTYLFNFGSFMSKFNTNQTIEYETNRFNLYNNINFLFKDLFNKSYFNYLFIILITIITILIVISYGVYIYFTFINNNLQCSYNPTDENISLIKQVLKCLCDKCHQFIPNCTFNYFIVFFIIIFIPISYLLRLFFNINLTPNSNSFILSYLYIALNFTLVFILTYNLFMSKQNDPDLIKYLLIYILFTIIFISSSYIYKYLYNKYNNINLNSSIDTNYQLDIYKQTLPNKPKPIQDPIFKNTNLLATFKYNDAKNDADYKIKKQIMDDYYLSLKTYDKDMQNYTQKYNIYMNSITNNNLKDKINYFDITINLLGLNNKMHLYILTLLIISIILYNFYNDDIIYTFMIYLLTLFITITIINAILYYNTLVNKYIIYEPMAFYKNDITNANTSLNLVLNNDSGNGFYNKLINNSQMYSNKLNPLTTLTQKDIINNIKLLTNIKNYDNSAVSKINSDIIDNKSEFITPFDNKSAKILSGTIYYETSIDSSNHPLKDIYEKIIIFINKNNNYVINSNRKFIFHYKNYSASIDITLTNYYRYVLYKSYQYYYLLKKINKKYLKLMIALTDIENIINDLKMYKTTKEMHDYIITDINSNINNIKNDSINKTYIKNIEMTIIKFKKDYLINIDNNILISSNSYILKIKKIDITKNDIESDSEYVNSNDSTNFNIGLVTENIYNNSNNIKKITLKQKDYYELPYKISDDLNNEYYINIFNLSTNINIILNTDYHENIKLIQYNNDEIAITYNNVDKLYLHSITNPITIPITIYKNEINETDNKNKLIKIILLVLYNNIRNITTKFEYLELQKKLLRNFNKGGNIEPDRDVLNDKIYYNKFYDISNGIISEGKSYIVNIEDLNYLSADISITSSSLSSNNLIDYLILMYNVFNVKNNIIDIIEYIIYNKTDNEINSFNYNNFSSDINLNEKIKNIKSQINKNVEKTEIIKLYERNKYIINLILNIYNNYLTFLKTSISKIDTLNLCFISSDIKQIEENIYNHLNFYFTITNIDPSVQNTYSTINIGANNEFKNPNIENKLNEIFNHTKYISNIILFLLKNLNTDEQILETEKNQILTNYNFYNNDIKLNDLITRQLIINCDYMSKYNNLDKNQLGSFKKNIDNVSYNFPILVVIFIVIFFEPIFIKS